MREPERTLPAPLYGCHDEGCAEEYSWPADCLQWWPGGDTGLDDEMEAGWYCDNCAGQFWGMDAEWGPTLSRELRERGLSR